MIPRFTFSVFRSELGQEEPPHAEPACVCVRACVPVCLCVHVWAFVGVCVSNATLAMTEVLFDSVSDQRLSLLCFF